MGKKGNLLCLQCWVSLEYGTSWDTAQLLFWELPSGSGLNQQDGYFISLMYDNSKYKMSRVDTAAPQGQGPRLLYSCRSTSPVAPPSGSIALTTMFRVTHHNKGEGRGKRDLVLEVTLACQWPEHSHVTTSAKIQEYQRSREWILRNSYQICFTYDLSLHNKPTNYI